MVSLDAILAALFGPMTIPEFWFGVFAALGAKKLVTGVMERAVGRLGPSRKNDGND